MPNLYVGFGGNAFLSKPNFVVLLYLNRLYVRQIKISKEHLYINYTPIPPLRMDRN